MRRLFHSRLLISAVLLACFLAGEIAIKEVTGIGVSSAQAPFPAVYSSSDEIGDAAGNWTTQGRRYAVNLLETGQFHGDEVTAKSGSKWYGLSRTGKNFTIAPITIKVETVFDPIVDEDGERTGKRVSAGVISNPIFLLDRDFRPGSKRIVPTLYAGETPINGKFTERYSLSGRSYELRLANGAKSKGTRLGSKLVLSSGGRVQILADLTDQSDEANWKIFWAGDLDNDGKLDLYVDLSNHYNVSDRILFLSTLAKGGKLVAIAGRFRTVGC